MSQAIQTATTEQIALFKRGAAAQYKARGIAPADADKLFDAHLAKMAEELGVNEQTNPKAVKLASELKKLLA
jgi:hypothetical protein